MKYFLIALTTILVSSPVNSHPRHLKNKHSYLFPEKDVMVRKDWTRCKKIKYTTKYDKWGWYTERKVLPLKYCWKNNNPDTKIKVIIK